MLIPNMPVFNKYNAIGLLVFGLLFNRMTHAEEYLFSAPPTETEEVSLSIYQPIAEYLSQKTGEDIVYSYPQNWARYISYMQQAKYDLLLDAPHFVSWRIEKIQHTPLISLAETMSYVVVVSRSSGLSDLTDLRGKSSCGSAIPNLDALTLLDQYDSNWTQPSIKVVQGFDQTFSFMLSGDCDAAVIPRRVFLRYINAPGANTLEVLFTTFELPHYGLSVSARVNNRMQSKITEALLSTSANSAIKGLFDQFGLEIGQDNSVAANADVYRGYSYLLDDFWGF
jgi:ABC-type phosphate/phosphonate transport system substrate-binding protein